MAKKVNEELNLTPLIGLFAMLVVLLLLTASWNKIHSFSTDGADTSIGDSAEQKKKKDVTLQVVIRLDRLELIEDNKPYSLPFINDEINEKLFVKILKIWKKKYPKKKDIVLRSENRVNYGKIIQAFDLLVGNKWPEVGVSTQ